MTAPITELTRSTYLHKELRGIEQLLLGSRWVLRSQYGLHDLLNCIARALHHVATPCRRPWTPLSGDYCMASSNRTLEYLLYNKEPLALLAIVQENESHMPAHADSSMRPSAVLSDNYDLFLLLGKASHKKSHCTCAVRAACT